MKKAELYQMIREQKRMIETLFAIVNDLAYVCADIDDGTTESARASVEGYIDMIENGKNSYLYLSEYRGTCTLDQVQSIMDDTKRKIAEAEKKHTSKNSADELVDRLIDGIDELADRFCFISLDTVQDYLARIQEAMAAEKRRRKNAGA